MRIRSEPTEDTVKPTVIIAHQSLLSLSQHEYNYMKDMFTSFDYNQSGMIHSMNCVHVNSSYENVFFDIMMIMTILQMITMTLRIITI